jgi:alpha-tubulin suppressor-like RCC1 family protein
MRNARLHTCPPDWSSMVRVLLLSVLLAALAACGGSDNASAPQGLSITQQPTDQSTLAGGSATFTANAVAIGALATYQWQILGPGGWTNINGATASTLAISSATMAQNGTQYRAVVAGNGISLISVPVTLTVTPAPQPPSIAVQPSDQTVTEPATAIFNATAGGTAPLTYQWQRNVSGAWIDVAGATGASYTTAATVRANDHGAQFRVAIANGTGSAISNVATLTVNPAPIAPAFTTHPANATVTEPSSASFSVVATGTPAPTLQWQVSNDGGATWANAATGSGATTATYTTVATTVVMSGWRYRAVATSSAGTAASNSATLTVNAQIAAPAITQHPANASVPSTTTATFTVVATGSPSPTYQWQRQAPGGGGFFNITGATAASYTTPSVYFLDDGDVTDTGTQYRVVVTNSQNSVISNAATLTVTPAVLIGFTKISAGQRHVLALRSDGTVWAWGNNGYGEVGRNCSACAPRPVNGLSGTFTQVIASHNNSYALRSDGTVWAWGNNLFGQLGRNLAANATANPTPAAVLRDSDGQPLTGIVGLTASSESEAVLAWNAAGAAWAWGSVAIDPNRGAYSAAVRLAATPHVHFDATTPMRTLRRASYGSAGYASTAFAIDGNDAVVHWWALFGGTTSAVLPASAIGFNGTAIDLAVGNNRVAIVRSDNTLWGQQYQGNAFGIVWDDLRSPLVQIAVPGPVTRAAVGVAGQVTYALGTSGVVYAAGADANGQLGDGSIGSWRTTFAPVLTINDATQISIGLENGLAMRPGGAIWGWGNNFYRTNGTTDSGNRPIGSAGWVQIEASPFATRGR